MTTVCPQCTAAFTGTYPRCPFDGAPLQAFDEDPLLGKVLDRRYRVEALIGSGAMGRVYRVKHERTGRTLALKRMFGDLAVQDVMRARFEHEARAVSQLDHPNVVVVTDFGESSGGLPHIVMEYLEGHTLDEWIRERGPMTEPWVARLLQQTASGLAHAHERGVVHRDLKPSNIFLRSRGGSFDVKIVDFGIAWSVRKEGEGRLTQTGNIVGTPSFMAPEQAFGAEVDGRADLFSLGVVGFYAFTGSPPFRGEPGRVLYQLVRDPVPPVREAHPGVDVSAPMQALLSEMSEREPEARPPGAAAIASRVEDMLAGVAPAVRPPPHRGSLGWVSAVATAIVGLIIGLGIYLRGAGPVAAPVVTELAPLAEVEPRPALPPEPDPSSELEEAPSNAEPPTAVAIPEPTPAKADEVEASQTDRARARPTRRTRRGPKPAEVRSVKAQPVPTPPPEPPPFRVVYKQVGARLGALATTKGEAAVAGLRERYFGIRYARALRDPAARDAATLELRAIGAALDQLEP